jgi:ribulose 1,5-bisphosphate synthetase/thiazole synthase
MGFFDNVDPTDLSTRTINDVRPIKVIVFGAGLSGILASILFPRTIENLELVIYEKVFFFFTSNRHLNDN